MPTPTSQYLLLLRGADWYQELSPQEIQEIMGRSAAWFERLSQTGALLGAQPLEKQARFVGQTSKVADGPFVESKETVGGYVLLAVSSLDEAAAIAQDCPMVPYGLTIEIRPVAPECATLKFVNQKLAESAA
jgi:hypothetical protein